MLLFGTNIYLSLQIAAEGAVYLGKRIVKRGQIGSCGKPKKKYD